MPSIAIRKAERPDAPILAGIAYDAWADGILPLLDAPAGLRDTERRRLANVVEATLERIIVAERDGLIAGWCSRARGRAYIPFLFVMPELQGLGIGSRLLERMETMLEFEGAERVRLETPADNVRAVRFYERAGYRILALGAEGPRAHAAFMSVHLEKRLDPFAGPVEDI